jgi:tRNA(Ile)-lysidine synthase
MILDRSLHPVERALAASSLIPTCGIVLVAVSGGADSMALVDALRTANRRARRLVVAHFDHRLRDESARDAEHVAAYARSYGLEFVLGSDDVARRARAQRASIEEAAREARYEFLSAVAERVGAECVAIGHTRSDQVETISMRILRGSGRVGIAGIPERRGLFVRPLLDVTRAETRDYCVTRGVAFVDDPSNADLRFERNRVRLDVLPALRASFPSIDEALLRLARSARREQEAFATRTEGWLRDNVREEAPGVWTLRLSGFDGRDDDDATALLREALVMTCGARDVDRAHYARLLELVRDNRAGRSADLPGFSARREHGALVLRLQARWSLDAISAAQDHVSTAAKECHARGPERRGTIAPAAVVVPGRTQIGDWTIEADFVSRDEALDAIASRAAGGHVAYFDADSIATTLVVRPTQAGDALRPFGLGGRKKLSDLFIDRKVPRRARARAIVIEGDSIYWVPGVARSDVGPIDHATASVVRLKATEHESKTP